VVPVQIDIHHIELPSVLPICQTSQYSCEFSGGPLHIPPARLNFAPSDSKAIFTGIPTAFIVVVSNKRATPITETMISGSIECGKSGSFRSATFPAIGGMRTATLTIPAITFDNPGAVVIRAVVEFKFETARQKLRAKETFHLEAPLNIGYRIRLNPPPVCEVNVENVKLQDGILNVREEIAGRSVDIAKFLGHGEGGSCYAVF
jgi:hypothetical protein